jgi:hypothetical protein
VASFLGSFFAFGRWARIDFLPSVLGKHTHSVRQIVAVGGWVIRLLNSRVLLFLGEPKNNSYKKA